MNKKLAAILVLFIAIVSVGAYYYSSMTQETGTITVSGAFALYPMMVKWAQEYQKIHPGVKIEVSAGGAGKGMTDALAGLVDIGMISREISPDETVKGAFFIAVAEDAVLATTNKNNPVLADILLNGVTESTFAAIFIFGNITTWGQVVGRPDIKDPIHVYTRSDAAGAADTWAKYLGKHKQEDLKGVGVFGDPGLVEAVKNDRLGIGYNNVNYAYDNGTGKAVNGITIVPIDQNDNGHLDKNEDFYGTKSSMVQAIASGAYPSPPARNLYLVTKGKFAGITKDFVTWILTDGQKFVPETGYIPLSQVILAEQLGKLQG